MRDVYAFVSRWRVDARPEACWRAFEASLAAERMPWWPAVRIARQASDQRRPEEPGQGVAALEPGHRVRLFVRSPLGYTLRVALTVTEVESPHRLAAQSTGDLVGRGLLKLARAGDGAELTWVWEVCVTRAWMRYCGPALRPVFAAAHRAVMARGERGFARYLRTAR